MDTDADTVRPARLRAHHLFCLRFFHGEGYTAGFVAALREAREAEAAAGIEVVEGTDDVCRACHRLTGEACEVDAAPERAISALDALATRLLDVSPGERIETDSLDGRVSAALTAWRGEACADCDYARVCLPRMEGYTT